MTRGRICHATLVLPEGIYQDGELHFSEGRIDKILKSSLTGLSETAAGENGQSGEDTTLRRIREEEQGSADFWTEWDLHGDFLIPGLIDTHVHGAGGFDVMDGTSEAIQAVQAALLQQGTTAFLATTMSATPERLFQVLSVVAQSLPPGQEAGGKGQARNAGQNSAENYGAWTEEASLAAAGAEILGVHMEGPFLSPNYKGAQAAEGIWGEDLAGAADFVQRIVGEYPGLLRVLTLAPERSEARELVECCLANGVLPSAGHSAASYEKMREAADWGLLRVTHAFNAMPGIHHRQPGLLTAALEDDRISLEIIADGVHIHPSILGLVFRVKPESRVSLVSDGTRAVGMADGEYELGGQRTFVQRGVARLADATIAGSAYPLLQGMRTLVSAHYPLHLAVKEATLNPARMLSVDSRLGSLAVNKEATFLRLSPDLEVLQVWQRGILVIDNLVERWS
ncbi:MAG: N-acetylglucosamine-6-phosphate deacetylase [Desulfitobacteriaceae bacterium]|nr:N-acetylglucosamine-6-phosphate deacetylase [Desulfitobacteriaceae bacterium]MDI6879562.1 N-acetylglucosamine-6-phosphate deacetylase [Desulfitobacteriaceae bacterium]MDI6913356.1 N-acetylglucosamine-6-phosphate deacetylase [Desulfitobacteriaceae bacterium]